MTARGVIQSRSYRPAAPHHVHTAGCFRHKVLMARDASDAWSGARKTVPGVTLETLHRDHRQPFEPLIAWSDLDLDGLLADMDQHLHREPLRTQSGERQEETATIPGGGGAHSVPSSTDRGPTV